MQDSECVMRYDDAERLTGIECAAGDGSHSSEQTRVFLGEELAEVTRRSEVRLDPPYIPGEEETETWTLGETVTRATTFVRRSCDEEGDCRTDEFQAVHTYEREGFQFLGHPFDPSRALEAPDSLLSSSGTSMSSGSDSPQGWEVDYTYDGPPREGTRTRTGSDGSVFAFRYDSDGRLFQLEERPSEEQLVEERYTHVGELLVEIYRLDVLPSNDDHWTNYEHDAHGNLIRKLSRSVDPPARVTDFDHDCW